MHDLINLREEELRQAKGFDYLKLKLCGSDLPDYVCRNLNDFLENRSSIGLTKTVIIPRIVYSPHPQTTQERLYLPITLKDKSAEITVYVRPQAFHTESGQFLVTALDDLQQEDLLVYATLRNGIVTPSIILYEDNLIDNKIYLTGFLTPKIKRPKKSGISDLVAKLNHLIPNLNLEPTPSHARV